MKRCRRRSPPRLVVHVGVTADTEIRQRLVPHRKPGPFGKGSAFETVALLTLCAAMLPLERKARIPVVLEAQMFTGKTLSHVAACAVFGELTVVRVFMARATVLFERRVADRRRHPRRKERVGLDEVTLLTLDFGVLAGQRVASVFMIDVHDVESLHDMTARTVIVELTEVSLVGMAIGAALERETAENLVFVTRGALDADVFSKKRKLRPSVVDAVRIPRALVVAPGALAPQARPVWVSMAIGARREPEAFPLLIRVAAFTLNPTMRTDERERGAGMIELDIRKRRFHPVALGTRFSELPPMHIRVTRDATRVVQEIRVCHRAGGRVRCGMTSLTGLHVSMEPDELVAALVVVERIDVPAHELEPLPLMLRMANKAIALVAMEASSLSNPHFEVLMASETFLIGHALARRMARAAVPESFELGMNTRERTWSDQRIETLPRPESAEPERKASCQDPPSHYQRNP